ncbi:telomere length regulation protein-domain-containing protein [Pilaira anomala]|nr:telomere length regulation protein-domain-containing protein [Pilaira anomala]
MKSLKELEDSLTELDQQALADNAQLDVILNTLSTPLNWFKSNELSVSDQLTLIRHATWKRHVWHVLKDIIPRWHFSLTSPTYRPLIESSLSCVSSNPEVGFAMVKVSLPILIDCLSSKEAQLDTLEIYASCLKYVAFDKHVFRLYTQYVTKQDVDFFCNLLCSIPGHLANVFGVQLDQVFFNSQHAWYFDRNFYAKMSNRLAETITNDTQSILFAKELVSKVTRQGYENILIENIYTQAKKSPEIWSLVISPSFNQLIKPILHYIKHTVLMAASINQASKELARILFSQLEATQIYLEEFLNTALLKLSKSSWADDTLARFAICTLIHVQGLDSSGLSSASTEWIIKYTKRLIETWSDPTFIKHASSREHNYITTAMLCLIAYLPNDIIMHTIMAQTSLFHSVSAYFHSGDMVTAQLGAVVAEAITGRTEPDKPIDTGLLDRSPELKKMKSLIDTKDAFSEDEQNEIQLNEIESESEQEEEDEEDELDPDAIYGSEEEVEESDDEFQAYQMEEESDDEGLKKEELSKSKAKKPVFVRDLIRYLQDQSDPLKLEIGLNAAEQIIRQKTGAGTTELSEYGVELAKYLIAFPETFEIDNYRNLQQNALIALIIAVPETVTGFIIDQFYDRNTSSGQKQLLLSVISLSVRELSNWTSTITNAKEETRKELEMVGTTLFVSKRMQLQKKNQGKVQKNRLAGLAGSLFFFPLLVGWWEGAQGRIRYWVGNDKVLTEKFIMTLNIILHCATNLPEKSSIVKEYFDFISSMRYASHTSLGIKKALLLGIETIINTSYRGQEVYLIQHYTKELSETRDWLEDMIENQSEAALQEKAIGILVRLSQIATSHS